MINITLKLNRHFFKANYLILFFFVTTQLPAENSLRIGSIAGFNKIISSKNISMYTGKKFIMSSGCRLSLTGIIENAQVYTLSCHDGQIDNLLSWDSSETIPPFFYFIGKIRLERNFLEIRLKKNIQLTATNKNLNYFRELLVTESTFSGEIPVNFDGSCPLEFLGKSWEFYWDHRVFYKFRITCIADFPHSIVQIPVKTGEQLEIKGKTGEPVPGEQFLGYINIKTVSQRSIDWNELVLYSW